MKISNLVHYLMIDIVRQKLLIGKLKQFAERNPEKIMVRLMAQIDPDQLTLSRISFFSGVMYILLLSQWCLWAVIVWLIGWLTDVVDGPLAVIFNKRSTAGKILDPLADRIYFLSAILTTLCYYHVSKIIYCLLLAFLILEALLPAFYFLANKIGRRKIKFQHNGYGKLKTILMSLVLPLIWLNTGWQKTIFCFCIAVIIFSLTNIKIHLQRYYQSSVK